MTLHSQKNGEDGMLAGSVDFFHTMLIILSLIMSEFSYCEHTANWIVQVLLNWLQGILVTSFIHIYLRDIAIATDKCLK